uniref:Nardilysin-like n=1 Tax=Nelumbo nucifera TaxID=4432 RepID=A0A822XZJ4_NELNU|nr:TPA_asm: hypothetical protein HUJ06_027268 [Nelumbo nucifera]
MVVELSSSYSVADDIVIKSPTDRRLYRIVHLSNGLCALLVHDPEIFPEGPPDTSKIIENGDVEEQEKQHEGDSDDDEGDSEDGDGDEDEDEEEDEDREDECEEMNEKKKSGVSLTKKATAAMCVGMGSFSDPFNAQGLAHFLEHMLFMGSTKFPDENEYDSYLSKRGGSSNAYTETEHTCYHFEVKREFLKGALERFSQFFISPLVKVEAMEREILAVDSEFNQVLQNDACRLQQLQCYTSSQGHPFNRFFWGNKKSLVDAMERGVNLREQILHLYRENYHGGLMKLVVIGGESLDVLQNWVVELFSDVRDGPRLKPDYQKEGPIWKAGRIYRLEAVKDVHILNLTWTLPCLHNEYMAKPEDYLAHLMGHEGRGSLLFFLKAKGWASSLSAGVGDEGMNRSSVAYIFGISIHLTDSGLEKVYEVIGVVYQYLKLLREAAPQEWIFKELQDIGNMEFRFAEEQPQDDYAAELAENLLVYPEKHVIYGDFAYELWDEKLIMHILSFFTPENMRVDTLSKSFYKQSLDFKYEPWFGSQYTEEEILPTHLELWRDPPEIDPALHMPVKNDFIPRDFSIRSNGSSNNLANTHFPRCILDQPLIKFWYKLDETFKLPRANTYFLITVKGGYADVKRCVLTELFVNLLKDDLNEVLYQAGVAKLETSLSIISDKIELKVYGFNDKLPILVSKILTVARKFCPTADRFKVIKEDMERAFRNANMKPLSHSSYLRLQVLREIFWDVDDKLACLVYLSLADLEAFIPELLSQLHIEGLCHGNLTEEEAINIMDIFRKNFTVPLPVEMWHEERVICFPSGANFVRDVPVKNKLETNSVVELYFQIEQDVGVEATRLRALADLFDDIIEEPLFDQLRTKEQLGYVVECSPRITYCVLGFCFCVQSSKYSPLYLQERIDSFIDGLQELLDKIDDEAFENYRSGLIAKKLEKDPSLAYETNHLWGQIVDKRYLFDMSAKEAEELRSIKKSDVIDWYNRYLRLSSPKCRRLVIRLWGCNTNMQENATQGKSVKVIEELAAFKTSAAFYPSLC